MKEAKFRSMIVYDTPAYKHHFKVIMELYVHSPPSPNTILIHNIQTYNVLEITFITVN